MSTADHYPAVLKLAGGREERSEEVREIGKGRMTMKVHGGRISPLFVRGSSLMWLKCDRN